jgi:hypothetical protein
MIATQPHPTQSIGAELERDRLKGRSRRMTVLIDSLRLHAGESGASRRHLRHVIADLEAQIEAIDARLQDLDGPRQPAQLVS